MASRRHETILLVEDEEGVRRFAARVLESAGYEVLAVADAAQARSLLEVHRGSIQLLVTDVMLPGEGGPDLARAFEESRPGVGILYLSGYGAADLEQYLDAGSHLLQKPFTPEALTGKVREILGRPR